MEVGFWHSGRERRTGSHGLLGKGRAPTLFLITAASSILGLLRFLRSTPD